MRILLTGLCTVHWGRLEFGNIGNYYITETSVRELHRVFPEAEIVTTLQMTDEFCARERVTCLPMHLFYAWGPDDVDKALRELGIASVYHRTREMVATTPYIDEVMKCDLVVDFSGEMWGDHAEPVGENRFLVDLLKNRTAQLLGKPVVLLAGSQGPFSDPHTLPLAKDVLADMPLVANREPASRDLLAEYGFDVSRVESFTCPAFLFEPRPAAEMGEVVQREQLVSPHKKTVGFVLCGFNFLEGPYDRWPRQDCEYTQFAEVIEFIVGRLVGRVVLMSHQNGFELPPRFKLINGRDYPIVKQLKSVIAKRGNVDMQDVLCIDRPYLPKDTKAIIGGFDMFVTGRVHGLVAALSQCVPSVLITRGFGAPSHRNIGFARSVGIEEYIATPGSADDMIAKVKACWEGMADYRRFLQRAIPGVQDKARAAFYAVGRAYRELGALPAAVLHDSGGGG